MQLALILAMLLLGGNNDIFNTLGQIKPVIEELGDENLKSTLSSVEQMGGIINTLSGSGLGELFSFNGSQNGSQNSVNGNEGWQKGEPDKSLGFPLKPVCKIADKNITYALSQYFAEEI
ncbi:MAG: hypothetical protein E7370_05145 [Clostridiales bacterium]|nr:hypothetical protein [Clostridiales bacterium]